MYFLKKSVTLQVSSLQDSSLPPAVRKDLVVSAVCAAAGGTDRTHHQKGRTAVECRFIQHVTCGEETGKVTEEHHIAARGAVWLRSSRKGRAVDPMNLICILSLGGKNAIKRLLSLVLIVEFRYPHFDLFPGFNLNFCASVPIHLTISSWVVWSNASKRCMRS